jgi:hypothetical protein
MKTNIITARLRRNSNDPRSTQKSSRPAKIFGVSSIFGFSLFCLMACGQQANNTDIPGINLPGDSKTDDLTEFDPSLCPDGGPHLNDGRPATWTVIHYAAGDNNLEDELIDDINEMELGHNGSKNVNVVVQLDKYREEGVWRYLIQSDNDMETINSKLVGFSEEEPDSGDWRTLAEFGKWAVTCYPADNYVLLIGGHGSGWSTSDEQESITRYSLRQRARMHRAHQNGESLRMIAPDDSHDSEIFVNQLAQALDIVKKTAKRPDDPDWLNRLVMYGSDACLMGTIEVAYELRNAVNYILGSEETEPGAGWPYNTIMRTLTQRPSYYAQRPYALAEIVVYNYGRSYTTTGSQGLEEDITFSALDTAAVNKTVNRVDTISSLLTALMDENEQLVELVGSARAESYTFGDGYTDLGWFLTFLRKSLLRNGIIPDMGEHWDGDERYRELRNTIDELMNDVWPELIVARISTDVYPHALGVSIFMPEDNCGYGLDLNYYGRSFFALESNWDEFVSRLINREIPISEIEYADGYGDSEFTLDTQQFTVSDITCDYEQGALYINTPERPCLLEEDGSVNCDVTGPSVYLYIRLNDDSMYVSEAYIWDSEANIDLESLHLNQDITDANMTPVEHYAGTVNIQFIDTDEEGQEITHDFKLEFACSDFEIEYCVDYDDYDY